MRPAAIIAAGVALAVTLALGPEPVVATPGDAPVTGEAERLLREAQESRGGVETLNRIVQIRRRGEMVVATPEGERRLPIQITVRPPGHLELMTGEGASQVRRVVERDQAYQVAGGGEPTPLSEQEGRRLRRLAMVDEAFLARFALSGALRVKGIEEAGPGEVAADLPAAGGRAILVAADDEVVYRLVVPREGGLPLRVDYDEGVGERRLSDVFVNWRVVEGILFPGEIILFRQGRAASVIQFSSIEVELAPLP